MERVVRALLLTDVVDSTKLVESLGEERAAEVWAAHDTAARELLAEHRGREIDKTDGFLMLFESAADAASYALAYHRALAALSTELGVALQARAGVHLDKVILRENPAGEVALGAKPLEVEGLAKPMAARVMSLARGGQTLLTGSARGDMRDEQPEGSQLEFHGHWRLKGVTNPVALFEIGMPGEAPFAPPPDAEKAYRVVQVEERWGPAREIPNSLPVERDAFVGREADLSELARRLDGDARVVTLLGPGGTGKTRLVTRYARTWMGDYPGGAWFCDLAGARAVEGIAHAVAMALDAPLGKDPIAQLGHAIAGRGRCLVILDNFEQVAEHAGETLGRWLERAPEASFVVTSRERLQLAGEEVLSLEPLPVDGAGVELFVQRARAQRKDFALNDDDRAAVGEVVRLLDGLPLAIELAAARTRMLSPAQLVERMKDRFKLLAGKRGATDRQATLRTAIDWSWDLLEPWEQATFAQCSVFEGGFTLEAAEEVLDLSAFPDAPWSLDAVQALLDKSLLRTWTPQGAGRRKEIDETYFGMYVSIQEYASEKLRTEGAILAERGEGWSGVEAERAAQERHGACFAALGTDEALDAPDSRGGVTRRRALALDLENLVAACRRAVRREDGATAVDAFRAAWEVLELSGPYALASALRREVLALASLESGERARALMVAGWAERAAGRLGEARELLEQALAVHREDGDRMGEGRVLGSLGWVHAEQGRVDEAQDHYEQALSIARELGNRRSEGRTLGSLARLYMNQGRVDDAKDLYEEALALNREVGDRKSEGTVLANLAVLCSNQDRIDDARDLNEQALAVHREVGNRLAEGSALGNLGVLLQNQGRMDEAGDLYRQALEVHREAGSRMGEVRGLYNLGHLHQDQGRVDEARDLFEQALEVHREVRNRRSEGNALANLGTLDEAQGRMDEARDLYEQALAVHREVGNRMSEGIVLGNLGSLHWKQGRTDEAEDVQQRALAVHREVGNRRGEGKVLGDLGFLRWNQGREEEGREMLATGEALLREEDAKLDLAALLCQRGQADLLGRDLPAAREALAEAKTLAQDLGAGQGSALGSAIAELEAALADTPES